ncbi:polysaccharide deacetylase family protein [uncultured Draconibacterium sp.]|uniref:polysaccharide deacetylase family protein n=1 Tax=uncultured Draconibacterium sp. TaxID=1573823 RepID=UPI0025D0A1F6|nr:polysaccharide deacetylase family protein [uncultured Draconibacterium sp.]
MKILTFDIEEWFHILDNDSTKTVNEWGNYEIRIHKNMERIFHILEKNNQKATFFCLGWIAEKYPEIIKEISNSGYEIGSHTSLHQLAYEQSPLEFKTDVEYSIKTLEDLTGEKIRYFRAPGFSIRQDNLWTFEILIDLGIEIDCSIFPAARAHGGLPAYRSPVPSLLKYNGLTIKELPINYTTLFNKQLIFSGGGYFRLTPYSLLKKWTKESDYVMSYLHPRDFDPNQPIIKELPLFRKFKSYVGLQNAEKKLQNWLKDFHFLDITSAAAEINWETVPMVEL